MGRLLAALKAERDRRQKGITSRFAKWKENPVGFVENELLGFLWSRQKQICLSVLENRRTAVPSCHDVGKSAIAARICAWWVAVHEPGEAFVVTLAPTFHQVRGILWREINRLHHAGGLPGRTNQTEWWLDPELVAFGRSPKDTEPTAIQGIHARRVLVVFDEACGIGKELWDASDSLIANEESRFLAIGNPDDPATEFAEICKPGSGWNVIPISVFDSPNFTGEEVPDHIRPLLVSKTWQAEKLEKWGEQSPLYRSKVLGQFPEQSSDSLVPISALNAATTRELEPGEPNELGVDVARFGGDATVIYHRRGPVATCVARDQNRDLMHVAGMVVNAIATTGAISVKVDDIGLGGGVTDRLRELRAEGKIPAHVDIVAINVGEAPATNLMDERFRNLRAELNWAMRTRFVDGLIRLEGDNEDLLNQAGQIKYKYTSAGEIQIEAKADMKKRTKGVSPDDWDALVLAFAKPDRRAVFSVDQQQISVAPFDLPRHWPRVWALDVTRDRVSVVWGAIDRATGAIYLYEDYTGPAGDLALHAAAIKDRGSWIPGVFDHRARQRKEDEGLAIVDRLLGVGLDIFTVETDPESAITEVGTRLGAKRLRVFSTLTDWLGQYRAFHRDKGGKVVAENDGLMLATGLLCLNGIHIAANDLAVDEEAQSDWAYQGRSSVTGY